MSAEVRNRRKTVSALVHRFEQINHQIEAEVFRNSKHFRRTQLTVSRKNSVPGHSRRSHVLHRYKSKSLPCISLSQDDSKKVLTKFKSSPTLAEATFWLTHDPDKMLESLKTWSETTKARKDDDRLPRLYPRSFAENEKVLRCCTQFSIMVHNIDIGERATDEPAEQSNYVSLSQLRKQLTLAHIENIDNSDNDEAYTDEEVTEDEEVRSRTDFKLEDNEGQYMTITQYRPVYFNLPDFRRQTSEEDKTLLYKTLHVYDTDQKLRKVENYKVSIAENKDEVRVQQFKTMEEYIVDELITTEEDYVRKLQYAIDNYYKFLERNIPKIVEKIFQNFQAIAKDSKQFLEELKNVCDCYEAIGHHFLKHKYIFERYLLLIRNKKLSENMCQKYQDVIRQREREIRDGHGLSSYLFKPIQRLGKYELLLKKLAKHLGDARQVKCINEAAEMMRRILSKGNDIIELDLIKGKPQHFGKTGKLILRDHFRENVRFRCDIVSFLFDRKLIFTRKDNKIADNYLYLNAIDVRSLGIIPDVDQAYEFTVQHHHHKGKVSHYHLIAKTRDIKSKWVKEIEAILWQQLEERKQTNNTIRRLHLQKYYRNYFKM